MTEYEIYFSFFGRHLKTTVSANSEDEAYNIVRNKIVFHKERTKIVLHKDRAKTVDDVDRIMNILGIKK